MMLAQSYGGFNSGISFTMLSYLVAFMLLPSLACATILPLLPVRRRVQSVTLVSYLELSPKPYTFMNTTVGGISGLAFDTDRQYYYALSDDRSSPRFYTMTFYGQKVEFLDVIFLTGADGSSFVDGALDPEGIVFTNDELYISTEGNAREGVPPAVYKFDLQGNLQSDVVFEIPTYYVPDTNGTVGIRNNNAFESLTISPDGTVITTANEGALLQDGPKASLEDESLCRILSWKVGGGTPAILQEVVYISDTVQSEPTPSDGWADNGLVEMVAIDDNGSFLALERSFAAGIGNDIRLYEVWSQGALNVSGTDSLFSSELDIPYEMDPPVQKRLLANLGEDLGVAVDNIEAMAITDVSETGFHLLLASDNNFNDENQVTQFVLLHVTFSEIHLAEPTLETKRTIDGEALDVAQGDFLSGDSDDPAIWLHPTDPSLSLVPLTLKDGGMVVYDLKGTIVQEIFPTEFGLFRYNNVDVLYAFPLADGTLADLVIVSDRANDTLHIWYVDVETLQLVDWTSNSMVETVFGVDDGEATAYGLVTYTSIITSKDYAFATQADGNKVAQLELSNDPLDGKVTAAIVRVIDLPFPEEESDAQTEGMVVDRSTGNLYIAYEDLAEGVMQFGAEPNAGSTFVSVAPIDDEILFADVDGLTIYYSDFDGNGYLLVSSQGDSSFGAYALSSDTAQPQYIGSFAIGERNGIDQVNESDGLDVLNTYLGPEFPCGIAIFQDGANDPQEVTPDEEELENSSTNFKFVPWDSVASTLGLTVNPFAWDPRRGALDRRLDTLQKDVVAVDASAAQSIGKLRTVLKGGSASLAPTKCVRRRRELEARCAVPLGPGASDTVLALLDSIIQSLEPLDTMPDFAARAKSVRASIPTYYF